ncbi:MAG: hypothetical protein JWO94_3179 [Verrucomicrobiaceae bacterium]|nr:hypothetical protein [Verrucomicrobiaceae bacterium]
MRWTTFGVLLLIALTLASFYRFPDLGLRPMHTDEAILGMKFLDFWRTGVFDYDPKDFHGPFLHYLTRAFAWAAHWRDPAAVTESGLRSVIAVCGVLLVLVTVFLTDALGRMATVLAMLMMAASPMMVFYSRYFIMEVPFVLLLAVFMIGCWRFAQGRSRLWLLVAGAALGCVHATKETFVINLAAMLCGWVAARVVTEGFVKRASGLRLSMGRNRRRVKWPWLWVAMTAVAVSVALFSGGFRHWQDVMESITTYASYVKRSGGAGGHEKPWFYYLGLIFWYKDSWVWSEALIGGLAVVGILTAFLGSFTKEPHRKAFLVFLSVYALAALTAYSIIPYKTPWTILSVQWALTLLAGVGGRTLYCVFRARTYRFVMGLLLVAGIYDLCYQTKVTIYHPVHPGTADQPNLRAPYVYSHTSMSAVKLVNRLRELAAFAPGEFSAQVINIDSGWPLPWYLRDTPHLGYQIAVPETVTAPVIVVDVGSLPAVQAKLAGKPYEADFFSLRPDVNVTLLVEKGLWDRFLAAKSATAPPP